ncbi:MAG TPA: type 4a pilus biogenesis protein PilO [Candidatus Sulfotelmatobacter sp.]|jgi:type IV pilus assembly protein PilO|nr:type 4a pilus biogenesis protein PilO [Candidatus Sulfotelmatobacter sp.]
MAISFREYPWFVQALIFFLLALVIFGLGEYLPMSPVAAMRTTLDDNHTKDSDLNRQVSELQVYERRNAEFKVEMAALEKQLETLKTIVPEDKEVDEFMRLLQEAAAASGVQIRSLTAQAVVPKDYHYELPFSISVDGPYFSIEDFFARLSRLSRIINVGDLSFKGLDASQGAFPMRPGTTVTGTCVVTTFFSNPIDKSAAAGKNPPARK